MVGFRKNQIKLLYFSSSNLKTMSQPLATQVTDSAQFWAETLPFGECEISNRAGWQHSNKSVKRNPLSVGRNSLRSMSYTDTEQAQPVVLQNAPPCSDL